MQCHGCGSEVLVGAKFCSQCGAPCLSENEPETFAGLEAIDFSEDVERLTRDFVGREPLFAEIEAWLKPGGSRLFLLTALPGLGKSAIAGIMEERDKGGMGIILARLIPR